MGGREGKEKMREAGQAHTLLIHVFSHGTGLKLPLAPSPPPLTLRSLLTTLESNHSLSSLRQDLLPFLTQQQGKAQQQQQLRQLRPAEEEAEALRRQGSMTMMGDLGLGGEGMMNGGATGASALGLGMPGYL